MLRSVIAGVPGLVLGESFRGQLSAKLGRDVPVRTWVFEDFHLDWLAAALHAWQEPDRPIYANAEGMISGTNRDIDELISFAESDSVHLALVEGKGDQPWDDRQLRAKARHLAAIFGERGDRWPGVVPSFCLLSATPPRFVDTTDWPAWMTDVAGAPRWLPIDGQPALWRPERCDPDGSTSATGSHWRRLHRTRLGRPET
jgi:hypothetical protein